MVEPVELFPSEGARYWRKEKLGSVRGMSVDIAGRNERPNELQVRLLSPHFDRSTVAVATFPANRMDDALATGRSVLKALETAEISWFRDER